MAKVAEALKGLTAYLQSENQRIEEDFKERKIDFTAEIIAKKFQELPPDASLQDIQKLQYETISQAAALGGLQENLPLISGLYNSTMQTRSLVEAEKHDEALKETAADLFGIDPGQMTGRDFVELTKTYKSMDTQFEAQNEAGQTFLRKVDVAGKETFNQLIQPLTRQEGLNIDFTQKQRIATMTSDLALRNSLAVLNKKQQMELDAQYGLSGVRRFKGMTFMRGHTTPRGDQLYTSKGSGTTFRLGKDGKLVQYWGMDIIPRQKQSANITDVMKGIQEVGETHQRARYEAGNVLSQTKKGREVIQKVLGRKIDDSDIWFENDKGQKVIRGNILTELELAFGKDDVQDRLAGMFTEGELTGEETEFQALHSLGMSLSNQRVLEKQLYEQIPYDKNYDNLTSPEAFNRGSNLLSKFVNNPEEYAGVAGSIYNYVNRKKGRPEGTPVSSTDIAGLDFDNLVYLNHSLSNRGRNYLGNDPKTPELVDLIRDEGEFQEKRKNKYPTSIAKLELKRQASLRPRSEVPFGKAPTIEFKPFGVNSGERFKKNISDFF